MGEILKIIEKLSGGRCYQSERFSLDHFILPEYQDVNEVFSKRKIFETDNKKGQNITLNVNSSALAFSLFRYFLDGSRRTYKIVDFGTSDGKFLPIVAGQIGAAVCRREEKKLRKQIFSRENVLAIPDRMGGEFEEIARKIKSIKIPENKSHGLYIGNVLKYKVKDKPDRPFENLAIAKIQKTMMDMEVSLIRKMVKSNRLETDKMLMVDGSLQFSGVEDSDTIFRHVIGVSKSFNPNVQGLLKFSKHRQIGDYLTTLRFAERTPVYEIEVEGKRRKRKTKIGAWYLRIRPREKSERPLDGIIKIEKIATTSDERENYFSTDMINNISSSLLLERNVTCYGKYPRWANHLYPIYLTEQFLKNSFVSDTFFLNIF
ncbi:MAG: hypothetical protein D3911_10395 [Candidatus Electrothrix sp. AW3_4]|nr:hypothetical protein [Candidatus Electrothrix gigas]